MALAAALLAGCSGTAFVGEATVPAAWRDLLPEGRLQIRALTPGGTGIAIDAIGRIVVTTEGWRVPELDLGEAATTGLRRFVQHGGRLVLLGYAAALAVPLGVETETPESEPFRWGYDARAVAGRARLGIEVTSGRCPELFEGLEPAAHLGEFTHLVAGGAPCCVPLCAWSIGAPAAGEVLARLLTELDGEPGATGPPVLVRWRLGRGEVLALGLVPDLENAEASVRGNARRLVQNLLGVGEERRGDALLLRLPGAPAAPPPAPAPALAAREVPMMPLLAHWGWSAPIAPGSERDRPRTADRLVKEVLVPSWIAGADLLELESGHPDGASPLVWSERDPLRRPDGFRGGAFGGAFGAAAFGDVSDEAHGRGMLVQARIDAAALGARARERLAGLRFVARELADRRGLGGRAVDGLGVREWLADPDGYSRAMVQDLHPGAFLYALGEQAPQLAGSLRGLDADDGALRGLAAVGLSRRWRDGFPGDVFPLGVLDARVGRALPSAGGATLGGGSYPDWIVEQANDFVRARERGGAALWWRAHDPTTLGATAVAYVHGISLDPLRAAVAMPLAATGENGYRAAAAGLLAAAPADFAAALPARASVHVLQNNWFRLLGSGGGLLFDPTGRARFARGEAVVVSPGLLQTRVVGGRPESALAAPFDLDLLGDGAGGEGGYVGTVRVGRPPDRRGRIPAQLAFDELPSWPRCVQVELELDHGYYELELGPRAVRGRGVVAVGLDGVVLDCRPFGVGERAAVAVVPVHVADRGVRVLELEVAEGGAVALDRLRLVRRGDVAVEADVGIAAGHVAEVAERSASSQHADVVRLRTIGDFPGLLLRIESRRAARNLRVERTFTFPQHGRLVAAAGEDARRLRLPFVLCADSPDLPDLVVVPVQLARYEHLRHDGRELVLHSSPEAGAESRIGLWLCPHGRGEAVLAHAPAVFRNLDQPIALDLGDGGQATLVSDLPLAFPRAVRVARSARTPYLVRENGWWTWRGAQPAADGGDWLRVCQLPGDAVEVVGGPAVLARTRPGPGSLRVLALRDPGPHEVRVRVLQPSRLAPPAVVMAADFDEVRLDGRPWAWFDGRTVFLPDAPGDYRVATRAHGGGPAPHVAATRAPLGRCEYDAEARELRLVCAADPSLPGGLPFTAVLRGPRPSRVTNGELVPDGDLPYADAAARARAAAGGFVIRFRPGLVRVHYED